MHFAHAKKSGLMEHVLCGLPGTDPGGNCGGLGSSVHEYILQTLLLLSCLSIMHGLAGMELGGGEHGPGSVLPSLPSAGGGFASDPASPSRSARLSGRHASAVPFCKIEGSVEQRC